jgi:hypothetical protein
VAETEATVARPQVRLLVLLIACALGVSVIAMRSREEKSPAPTGRTVPAEVRMSAPLRLGGAPLECQEVRLTRHRLGVRVYSRGASLSVRSESNVYFSVDVRLRLGDRTVSGNVLGTREDPFVIASGATTVKGVFGWIPPLDVGGLSNTPLVTSAGSPVEVPEGTLTGCDVSFVSAH